MKNPKTEEAISKINLAWANLSFARSLLLESNPKEYAQLLKIGDRLEKIASKLSR